MLGQDLITPAEEASVYHTFQNNHCNGREKTDDESVQEQSPFTSAPDEDTTLLPSSPKKTLKNLLPCFLLVCASFMYSGVHVAVRVAANKYDYSITFITFFRSIISIALAVGIMICFFHHVFSQGLSIRSLLLLLLRGFLGALAIIFHYAALAKLPVAIATALFSTRSIFASLLGFVVLGERLTGTDQAALVVTITGSVLVGVSELGKIASHTSSAYGQGVVLALASSAVIGAIYVLMRMMGTKVHFMLSLFTMSTCAALTSFLLSLSPDGGSTGTSFGSQIKCTGAGGLIALLSVGLFSFAAGMFFNRGTQLVPAGRAAVLRTADIPINFLVGLISLGELPRSPLQLSGCFLITVGAYLAALKEAS